MQILTCINRFLLDLEEGVFSQKRYNSSDDLMDMINIKKEQFVNDFAEETAMQDIEYALKISNFLIMLYQFKKKFNHYFSMLLEDFLRQDIGMQQKVLDFINESYKKMCCLSSEDYARKYGKMNLSPEDRHQALLEWAGGF